MAKMTKEERIVALQKAYCDSGVLGPMAFAIEEQDRREGPLVASMRRAMTDLRTGRVSFMDISLALEAALAAYDALDAKHAPTLLEAARAFIDSTKVGLCVVNTERMASLKAAVEREERRK